MRAGLGWLHSRKTYVHLQVRADNVLVCEETMHAWLMGVGESFLRKRMDMADVSLIDRTVGYAVRLVLGCDAVGWWLHNGAPARRVRN